MKTSYFTFGFSHIHKYGGKTLDKDVVVKITSNNPRQTMLELFGQKWSMEYNDPPSMELFKEIFEIK